MKRKPTPSPLNNKKMLKNLLPNILSEETQEEAPWMMTLMDLTFLLLTFFILLYSMSKLDTNKYNALVQSFGLIGKNANSNQNTDNNLIVPIAELNYMAHSIYSLDELVRLKEDEIARNLNVYINEKELSSSLTVYKDKRGVVLKINDSLLFTSGSANLNPQSLSLLNYLVNLLKTFPYPIKVEGHTDNTPINTPQFPSNWELSTSRASNVIKYFIQKGLPPSRFSAEGYAEYRPIADNRIESGKTKNRRIEIIFNREGILSSFDNPKHWTDEL